MLIRSTWQTENISGYFNGLSSPSGTLKIMAFAEAPVSNSAGQTRFPTFSRIARSRPSVPSAASPCLVMSASRWHMPPVCSCTAFTFVCAIRNASTSESMSASMTPIFISSRRSSMVFSSVVVFPAPGEDIRFRRNTPFSFSSFLRSSACLSLSAKTLCLISYTFTIVFSSMEFIISQAGGKSQRFCPKIREPENRPPSLQFFPAVIQ